MENQSIKYSYLVVIVKIVVVVVIVVIVKKTNNLKENTSENISESLVISFRWMEISFTAVWLVP